MFVIDAQLDLDQIRGIVKREIAEKPELANEIKDALSDDSLCWREILDDPDMGEIYATDSEELAREYARQMLNV